MKRSKKAWKEYFDDESNWEEVKSLHEYGMRIVRLKDTKIFALERWNVPFPYLIQAGFKSSWVRVDCFVCHQDEDGVHPEQMNKTNVIETLWLEQEGSNA